MSNSNLTYEKKTVYELADKKMVRLKSDDFLLITFDRASLKPGPEIIRNEVGVCEDGFQISIPADDCRLCVKVIHQHIICSSRHHIHISAFRRQEGVRCKITCLVCKVFCRELWNHELSIPVKIDGKITNSLAYFRHYGESGKEKRENGVID